VVAKKERHFYSLEEFRGDVSTLVDMIRTSRISFSGIYGIPSGGIPLAMELAKQLGLPLLIDDPLKDHSDGRRILVVDDLVDTGRTIERFLKAGLDVATLHVKQWAKFRPTFCANPPCEHWIVHWWEGSETKSIEDAIIRQLQFIGEDPTREGLRETPGRVVRAMGELFQGYKETVDDVFKDFDGEQIGGMVYLKDVEFFSTCEHHMVPFNGVAHMAYIPNGRVIGASKLARLLDVYCRRLQIQERIGEQVTTALMEKLKPKGAACIIEGKHLCISSRGVRKQHSILGYSSMKGSFLEDSATRLEFILLCTSRNLLV
jgi:GTP cyclohydrolase I